MLSRQTNQCWESFPLREMVQEVGLVLTPRLADQAIDVLIDIPPGQQMTGWRESLRQAVENLMLNAVEAMPSGGLLVATSANVPGGVELEIADTGPAMSDEERQQAFDLMPAMQRNGADWELAAVQLAAVRRIAEMHGGSVSVANCPDGGVAFTLRIPHRVALEAAA